MRISVQQRPALGLGLSLFVHAAVLAWLAHLPPISPLQEAPPARMQVTLLRLPPPRPEPEPVPTPVPERSPAPSPSPRARAAKPAAPAQRPAAAAEPAPTPTPTPDHIIAMPPGDKPGNASEPGAAESESGATSFDLQAARGTARAWVKGEGRGRGGADGLGTPMRPTRSEQLGQALERARRPDCRGAYSGMGVLAVIPLAKDTLTGKGCKW